MYRRIDSVYVNPVATGGFKVVLVIDGITTTVDQNFSTSASACEWVKNNLMVGEWVKNNLMVDHEVNYYTRPCRLPKEHLT